MGINRWAWMQGARDSRANVEGKAEAVTQIPVGLSYRPIWTARLTGYYEVLGIFRGSSPVPGQ